MTERDRIHIKDTIYYIYDHKEVGMSNWVVEDDLEKYAVGAWVIISQISKINKLTICITLTI